MEDKNPTPDQIVATAGLVVLSVSAVCYVKAVMTERKKRKKLEAWKQERLACVENGYHTLMNTIRDPQKDHHDFVTTLDVEGKFMDIINQIPPY